MGWGMTEAQADILDSLSSPMTATGVAEDTGRDLTEVIDAIAVLASMGRIQQGDRGEWRVRREGGQHYDRALRVERTRGLIQRQGWTTVEQIAECAGVGREAARAYLCEVGAVSTWSMGRRFGECRCAESRTRIVGQCRHWSASGEKQ
jgi:hypothetical protein